MRVNLDTGQALQDIRKFLLATNRYSDDDQNQIEKEAACGKLLRKNGMSMVKDARERKSNTSWLNDTEGGSTS